MIGLNVGLFIGLHPLIVSAMAGFEPLSLYVVDGEVEVGVKPLRDGYSQIYYRFEGQEVVLTDERYTSAHPVSSGDYISWMSLIDNSWQIFVYNVSSQQTIQLTHLGSNVNPSVSDKYVAWEGQEAGVWQVFAFDGIRTKQLTEGSLPSQNATVLGSRVAYEQKAGVELPWKIFVHNLIDNKTILLTPESYGKSPSFKENSVRWQTNISQQELAFMQYDLATGQTFASKSPVELDTVLNKPLDITELTQQGYSVEDAKNKPLLEVLQELGVLDERGRVTDPTVNTSLE
ncbi:MAG: hypothetical protein M3Q81_00065 [bacterium]|nr:hypothetical protein [bacterium]